MNPTPLFLLNSPKSQNKLLTQYKLCCIPKAEVKNKILDALIGKKNRECHMGIHFNTLSAYFSFEYIHSSMHVSHSNLSFVSFSTARFNTV